MAKTPFDFGAKGDGLSDDTDALGRWAMAGGGEIPAGTFRFNGPLRYSSGFTISRWEGKLLYGRGWPSGYALCSRDWSSETQHVRIDATAGGEIIYNGVSDMPRKGVALTYVRGFEIVNATVVGGAAPKGINLFSGEVRYSRQGVIRGGRFSVLSGQQGADGIHFVGDCSDVELVGVRTMSGDDSVGLTIEDRTRPGRTIQNITLSNCDLDNVGHSSLKVLLSTLAQGSVIRNVTLKDCRMRTQMHPQGAGTPIAIWNRKRDIGARIEQITIQGGSTEVIVPEGGLPGLAAMETFLADDIRIVNHDLYHWHRMAIMAVDCRRLVVEGGRFAPIHPVPRATQSAFRLVGCDDARIDLHGKAPAWAGQTMLDHLPLEPPAPSVPNQG